MTNKAYAETLKDCASMLTDGIKYMKEEHQKQFKEAYEKAIEKLSVEQTEWISVKDRLPTENDEYYVSIRYECNDGTAFDDVTTCYFWTEEGMWNRSERMIGKILAWQPITEPSPYKGDVT